MAAAIPSTSPKETNDVKATGHALRPDTRARNALPEGRAGLGRTHRFGARPSQKLEADGLRLPDHHPGLLSCARLAVGPPPRRALGGGVRQHTAAGRVGK